MALPLVAPKFQAFDSNGDPLVGGKLYTFEPGTTTPKATFTTSALSVANANPVILDSRGEADVWPSGTTKYVLKDSSDNTIWTVDNVGGNPLVVAYSFKANKNGTDQTGIVSATNTKLTFTNELWDGGGWYDTSTSRYTPQVAGRYRFAAAALVSANVVDQQQYVAMIYKNGSLAGQCISHASGTLALSVSVDVTMPMNGSTDYVEVYVYGGGAGNKTVSGTDVNAWFEGHLVEAT